MSTMTFSQFVAAAADKGWAIGDEKKIAKEFGLDASTTARVAQAADSELFKRFKSEKAKYPKAPTTKSYKGWLK